MRVKLLFLTYSFLFISLSPASTKIAKSEDTFENDRGNRAPAVIGPPILDLTVLDNNSDESFDSITHTSPDEGADLAASQSEPGHEVEN